MIKDEKSKDVFRCLVRVQVGNSNNVLFWTGRWINGSSVQDLPLLVLIAIPTKTQNKRTVADALLNNSWVADIQDILTDEGVRQCLLLSARILEVQRDALEEGIFNLALDQHRHLLGKLKDRKSVV